METLFILRDPNEPLSVGQEITAQGFMKYRITVKRLCGTKIMKNGGVQWTIKGTREAIPDEVISDEE